MFSSIKNTFNQTSKKLKCKIISLSYRSEYFGEEKSPYFDKIYLLSIKCINFFHSESQSSEKHGWSWGMKFGVSLIVFIMVYIVIIGLCTPIVLYPLTCWLFKVCKSVFLFQNIFKRFLFIVDKYLLINQTNFEQCFFLKKLCVPKLKYLSKTN